jgi:hypothetical protein
MFNYMLCYIKENRIRITVHLVSDTTSNTSSQENLKTNNSIVAMVVKSHTFHFA